MSRSRRYPQHPLVGVGALVFDGDRILIVERGQEPLKGYWSLPGGLVETGELLQAAIRREVMEETGLEVEVGPVLEIFERLMSDAEGRTEYHYVLIDYLCRVAGGQLKAASDVSRAVWATRFELADYQLTEGTLPVIEKGFRQR